MLGGLGLPLVGEMQHLSSFPYTYSCLVLSPQLQATAAIPPHPVAHPPAASHGSHPMEVRGLSLQLMAGVGALGLFRKALLYHKVIIREAK